MLYILDWKTKAVSYRIVPVPGAEGVDGLVVARDGLVYAITTPPTLFVFDPKTRRIIHQRDLAEHGTIAYNGLRRDRTAGSMRSWQGAPQDYAGTFAVEKLAEPPQPARAGTAVLDGRVYFVIDSHLWSYPL